MKFTDLRWIKAPLTDRQYSQSIYFPKAASGVSSWFTNTRVWKEDNKYWLRYCYQDNKWMTPRVEVQHLDGIDLVTLACYLTEAEEYTEGPDGVVKGTAKDAW